MKARDEVGFTLVELLIAVSILGVVISAVAAAMVVGLKTTDDTTTRLSESHDTQISTAYFGGDAQSADNVTGNVADSCAGAGSTALVRFNWSDPVNTTTNLAKTVVYVIVPNGSGRELHRRYCEGTTGTVVSEVVVAHNLHPSTAPTVTCLPSCPGKPDSVTITVTEATAYTYTLTGTRRTS